MIADRVFAGPEQFRCDEHWRVSLAAKLAGAHQGPIAASEIILEDAGKQGCIVCRHRALAVDMESAVAARFATAAQAAFRGACA